MSSKITKLKAVNIMLRSVGQAPVNSEENLGRLGSQALDILEENTLNIQQKPWYFNYYPTTLTPNLDNEIMIPSNIIEVDPYEIQRRYTELNGKLYNYVDETFKFDKSIEVFALYNYDFNELSYSVQYYITMTSCKELYSIRFPKGNLPPTLQERFLRAEANVNAHNTRVTNANLKNNKTIQNVLFRR